MNLGLLILRAVVGAVFIGHGTQKLFGWFGGKGPEGTAAMFSTLGYPRAPFMAHAAGIGEAGGGAFLLLGLATPLGAAMIIGVMLNAIISVHVRNGMWVTNGGMEYPIVLATVATSLAFIGAGTYSLDAALAMNLSGMYAGLWALIVGLGSGGFILLLRRSARIAPATQQRRAA